MKYPNIVCAFTGLIIGVSPPVSAQTAGSDTSATATAEVPPASTPAPSGTKEQADGGNFDIALSGKNSNGFWKYLHVTGGQMTLPFKIRPKADTHSFRLTTDVTVGAYVGLTWRLSEDRPVSITVPLAAGLTFININDSNTSLDLVLQEAEVVPGISWSTGIIVQLGHYNLGLMFGKDYASEIGNQWQYHRKIWWSFGIGFQFMR
ncbi:MAG: hypothetical protein IPH12_19135 [Saprospirales bacterium]|jgi:hypothetical protein|nr:hypothetical protein [Saprospirales bacterium]MBK8920042.1 hypothetical protein [Saprospirales bacterium]